jgi:glycosyltransferase involved in cell wall biosynthesis
MTHTTPPIKILHIFGRMVRDGAETRTLEIMRNVDRDRYQLHFCSLSGLPGDLDDEIRALGGQVHLCRLAPDFPWRFLRLLREQQFDVIHSHVHYFSGYLLRLAARAGIPTRIAHFRITDDGQGNNIRRRYQRRLMRYWIDRYATCILAVCQAAMEASWGPQWRLDPRCQIIYNGLDLSAFEQPPDRIGVRREFNLPPTANLYIHVGRMDPQKNHQRVLSIFAELLNHDAHAFLLFVGRGDNAIERQLRLRANALRIGERVIIAGKRSDVPRLLQAADLLLFPSLWEGLPGVVLEAGAAGTPVIASNLPGINEIAAQLPLIRCLPLDTDDHVWAQAANSFSIQHQAPTARTSAVKAFASSVFNIHDCTKAHCLVWQSQQLLP